jgi:hypothetical protein
MRALPVLLAALVVATALAAGTVPGPAGPSTDGAVRGATTLPDAGSTGDADAGPALGGTVVPAGAVVPGDPLPVGSPAQVAGSPTPVDDPPAQVAGSPTPVDDPPAQVAGPPAQVNDSNESLANEPIRVLDLPQSTPTRSVLHAESVDLGPATGFAANASAARLETIATVQHVREAETDEERQRRILEAVSEIEQAQVSLRSDQREAIGAFADGRIDARSLLVRLARIDARAAALDERRAQLDALSEATEDFSLESGRLPAIETELRIYSGPLREHLVEVLRGEEPPTRFYVAATTDGVVLSAIVDDTYVRETYREDLRSAGAATIDLDDALDNVTAGAYPVVWAIKTNADGTGSGGSLIVRVPHPRGNLTAFVDGGSRNVFREYQVRPLASFVDNRTATGFGDGLRLTVNRTYAGGPMRVRLEEVATGEPRDLLVTVRPPDGNSIRLGRTGSDGVLWTLTPAGQFTVATFRATDDPTFVTTPTIRAAVPPDIYNGSATGAGGSGSGTDTPTSGTNGSVSGETAGETSTAPPAAVAAPIDGIPPVARLR